VQIPFLPPKTVHLDHLSWLLRLANTSASGFIAMVHCPQKTRSPRLNTFMKIFEVTTPKTPEQQRMASLRASSKRASDALKQERDRQKLQKAQKTIQAVRFPKP